MIPYAPDPVVEWDDLDAKFLCENLYHFRPRLSGWVVDVVYWISWTVVVLEEQVTQFSRHIIDWSPGRDPLELRKSTETLSRLDEEGEVLHVVPVSAHSRASYLIESYGNCAKCVGCQCKVSSSMRSHTNFAFL